MVFTFVETRLFTGLVSRYLSDDEYADLQRTLIADPEAGDVIRGTGGVRKLRWGIAGRGKRGGIRIIYYVRAQQGSDLDAHALREERGTDHSGTRAQENQGGDQWLSFSARSGSKSWRVSDSSNAESTGES